MADSAAPPNIPAAPYSTQPILVPALKVGALTGATGVLFGGVVSVLRSSPTVGLFALGTGVNCFTLGSTYWAIRGSIFRLKSDPTSPVPPTFTPQEKVYVSGAAGALTGFGVGLLFRGRSNAIPGAIVWGLLGLAGQYGYNLADEEHTREVMQSANLPHAGQEQTSLLDRAFRSKWNPVKKLTDDEYLNILRNKSLALEAQIQLTQEQIDRLKAEHGLDGEESK